MSGPITFAELKSKVRAGVRAKDAGAVSMVRTAAVESIDEEARTATFVLTDATQDHVGDRLLPEGAQLDAFMRNPAFLWMHEQDRPPLGKWLNVWMEGGQIKGTAYFTPPEVDEPGDPAHSFSERCWSLVKAGILKAVSVFFKGIDASFNGDGFDVTKWVLLECSLVTVGMNPNALLDGKSAASLLEDRMKPKALTEGNAEDGGSAVKGEDIEKCMKGLQDMQGQMAKALADHAKLMASHADIMGKHAKALADADAHATKLAAVHQDMKALLASASEEEPAPEDAKAKAARLARAKSSKVLSEKNYGRLKAAVGHVQSVIDEHNAKHGAPDTDDDPTSGGTDADPKSAKDLSPFDAWLKSLTPEQMREAAGELADNQIRTTRGEIT